jgi:hypothetical protein
MELPCDYTKLEPHEKRDVREQYIKLQSGLCLFCSGPLLLAPPKRIRRKSINWSLFPENFLQHPIHLQHDHNTGMTEGAVHAYCNAVMWQYLGR